MGQRLFVTLDPVQTDIVSVCQFDQIRRSDRRAEFAMHGRNRHIVDVVGIVVRAVQADPVGGRTGVVGEIGVVAQITCHPCGRFDAEVGEKAGNNQPINTVLAQTQFEICADKTGVNVLFDYDFIIARFKAFNHLPGRK